MHFEGPEGKSRPPNQAFDYAAVEDNAGWAWTVMSNCNAGLLHLIFSAANVISKLAPCVSKDIHTSTGLFGHPFRNCGKMVAPPCLTDRLMTVASEMGNFH